VSIVMNLAEVLEKALERMVREFLDAFPGAEVVAQEPDRTVFVDGEGEGYRSIRPDLLIRRDGQLKAILDAKFKPKYVDVPEGRNVPPGHRVSTADLFQMAFYQAHLKERYRLGAPPPCAIVAPGIQGPLPGLSRRSIAWEGAGSGASTQVLPLSLPALARILRDPTAGGQPLDAAPELKAFILQALGGLERESASVAACG
jgi:hypothetical protein